MSNEKTGRRGKKRIWGKDDTELSLLALPTTIWYLLFCFFCRCSVSSSHLRTTRYTVDF